MYMGKVGQIQNNARTEEVARLVKHLLPRHQELLLTSGTVCKARGDGTHPEPMTERAEQRALAWIWVPVLALPFTAHIL